MRYSVQAAARATGISESRLRTWERRYGVPRPGRSATGRRLYDEDDLALIRRMAALVAAGVPAAQAAEAAMEEGGLAMEGASPAPPHPMRQALFAAARTFDAAALDAAVEDAIAALGWEAALDRVLFPFLHDVGRAWERGELSLTHEHFASELIRRALAAAVDAAGEPVPEGQVVLLACPGDERHELGLLALWLLLARAGLRVIYLGADVPAEELVEAIREVTPAAVCLSGTAPTSLPALHRTARAVIASRVDTRLFVGGPALATGDDAEVPGIRLPGDVGAAARAIVQALGSDPA